MCQTMHRLFFLGPLFYLLQMTFTLLGFPIFVGFAFLKFLLLYSVVFCFIIIFVSLHRLPCLDLHVLVTLMYLHNLLS